MSKRKKKKGSGLIGFLVFLCIVGGGAYFAYNYVANYNVVFDESDTDYYSFTVSPGMTGDRIAAELQNNGFIKSAALFGYRAKLSNISSKFQAGDYQLSPSMSTEEIFEALQNAKRETVSFTIPEGYCLTRVAEKLVADGLLTDVNSFYTALEDDYNYDFIPEGKYGDPTGTLSAKANRLEGYLAPNTYQVFLGATAHDIIDKMLSGFDKIYSEEFSARAKELGYSDYEIVTIASMIEGETKLDSERAKVASVIYNRLNIGMKLQLDACVQYCLGEHKERVYYKDLEMDSPYNTYKVDGIPAGPICSPRKESIEAALYPESTDYIYYVLKPDNSGSHNFAETAAEFNKYKQQYINSL